MNVLTPLPEEEEQPPDEEIPRSIPPLPPHSQPTTTGPSTEELSKSRRDKHEMRTLLHPYEAARQARAPISRGETDEHAPTRTSQETMVINLERLGCTFS